MRPSLQALLVIASFISHAVCFRWLGKIKLPFKAAQVSKSCTSPSQLYVTQQPSFPVKSIDSEEQLLQDLTSKLFGLLDLVSKSPLNSQTVRTWESNVAKVAYELRTTYNKKVLLAAYTTLLSTSIAMQQDALQATTVDILNGALLDGLLKPLGGAEIGEAELTDLIDELTDIQLGVVEKLPVLVEKISPGRGDDPSLLETLCYQLSLSLSQFYTQVCERTDGDIEVDAAVRSQQVKNWCMPVNARLQRRYPRFVSSAAAEKGKKTKAQQLDTLIRRLPLTLSTSLLDAADASFPPAELCALLGDAMRCAAADVTDAVDADVEERLVMRVREGLVARAKGAAEEVRSHLSQLSLPLGAAQLSAVRRGVDLGGEVAGIVAGLWNVEHNVLLSRGGDVDEDQDEDNADNEDYDENKPNERRSMFIAVDPLPSSLRQLTPNNTLSLLPPSLRWRLRYELDQLRQEADGLLEGLDDDVQAMRDSDILGGEDLLLSCSLLGLAVRRSCAKHFRCLLLYEGGGDAQIWEGYRRDAAYLSLLSALFSWYLTQPSPPPLPPLVLGLSSLGEVWGVKEPAYAARCAFSAAVSAVLSQRLDSKEKHNNDVLSSEVLRRRIVQLERVLVLMLRVDVTSSSPPARASTFVDFVAATLERGGASALRRRWAEVAQLLSLPTENCAQHVQPLLLREFDKLVTRLLLSADIAFSLPAALGAAFVQQVQAAGEDAQLSPDEARERVGYLAGGVLRGFFTTLLDMASSSSSGSGKDGIELARRTYTLYQHPLLRWVQDGFKDQDQDQDKGSGALEMGLRITLLTLPAPQLTQLVRVLDGYRQRLLGAGRSVAQGGVRDRGISTEGWGGAGGGVGSSISMVDLGLADDTQVAEFILKMQTFLMQEYAQGVTQKFQV